MKPTLQSLLRGSAALVFKGSMGNGDTVPEPSMVLLMLAGDPSR